MKGTSFETIECQTQQEKKIKIKTDDARQLVQKELAVMKGVGLGSSTFARPPPLSSRWNDTFIRRKMEFKGWVTDYSESCFQGVTDDEVTELLIDLERMVPQQAQKWIDWDQTRKEHGTWPRKIMVIMWCKHEANLVTMIDWLKIMKEELDKAAYKIGGQNVKARLEVCLQRRPWPKAQAMFFKRTQGGGR